MVRGYARVSTKSQAQDGNSLEAQEKALIEAGVNKENIYKDSFTGTKMDRPAFDKLLNDLKEGDTLVVTKLDRFARSMSQGSELVNQLISDGIRVHILNIGILDNKPASKLIRNIFFAFAEFERDMIIERTGEGKAIARANAESRGETFKDGRPKKYNEERLEHALELLKNKSYSEVIKLTGISKSTLIRYRREKELIKELIEKHSKDFFGDLTDGDMLMLINDTLNTENDKKKQGINNSTYYKYKSELKQKQ